jgi:two-component system, chemotaxis family, CheB/CheR fusion protein
VSSGEEAYSTAMLLAEQVGKTALRDRVKIYATDVDEEALALARQGTYSAKAIQPIPSDLVERYFDRAKGQYTVGRELRRVVIFGRHDLVHDAPISKVDLVVCRNTLMYLNADTQARVLANFHFALTDEGFMLLGKAEMLFSAIRSFAPVDLKRRVFAKIAGPDDFRERVRFAGYGRDGETAGRLASHAQGREAAFDAGPIPMLVVDHDGYLVMVNERARRVFGLSGQDIGRPFHELEVSYRPAELRSTLSKATADGEPIRIADVNWVVPSGEQIQLTIDVIPLFDAAGRQLATTIAFTDITGSQALQEELERANQELETAMEELQSTNEELETTNEELQSTNEELETTNEELQSTNEELETINEELQSINEELQAVNEEMQEQGQQLTEANAFLEGIMSSVHSGLAVLGQNLMVRAWNVHATEMWGLRQDEVVGESFVGLGIGLPVRNLERLIANALGGAGYQEAIVDAVDRRGRAFRCRVSCSSLRVEQGLGGVILLMEDDDAQT